MMTIQAINPATSEVLKTYEEMAPATVKDIVSKTHEAFLGWRRTTFRERAGLMRKAAETLRCQRRRIRASDGTRDGQACARWCRRDAEVRVGM
jgi:acyl-CoA reductase-like NAD-dependent aldehyde dehydrogenase